MRYFIISLLLCFCLLLPAQTEDEAFSAKYQQEELISIARNTNLIAALRAIEVVSMQFENKKIVVTATTNDPISYPINKLYWRDALELIVRLQDLDLEERPGSFIVSDPQEKEGQGTAAGGDGKEVVTPLSKQIRISSIFFKADKTLSREIGIDWSTLLGGKVNTNINFNGASKVGEDIFNAGISHNFQTGNVTISLDVLLRILEQYQRGSVVARPSVSVLSGKNGKIQVGQDFSVKTLDDAGNAIETFYSAGIILNVTPQIVEKDGEEAIYLEASVEKSTATPGDVSTIIDKSSSDTKVLLFDGEETVIAGLYDSDKQVSRAGVPLLKDLPWWVFGLRYIFGYNSYSVTYNEMIIILKAEIIDGVSERKMEMKPLEQQVQEQKESYEKTIQKLDR
ncbi:MAG TPA: type II and III secretion system protein [Candidatus Cloacimonadota bacterium]|nr:type II and III secretion system protein [Candidatus Cloacimonadota bacterium]